LAKRIANGGDEHCSGKPCHPAVVQDKPKRTLTLRDGIVHHVPSILAAWPRGGMCDSPVHGSSDWNIPFWRVPARANHEVQMPHARVPEVLSGSEAFVSLSFLSCAHYSRFVFLLRS
jgi:hypothetical protein